MLADYHAFLESKHPTAAPSGFNVQLAFIQAVLFLYQREIVRWALLQGRAAIFAAMGMGKTLMELEWARHVALRTEKPVLILAPLAVSPQTVEMDELLTGNGIVYVEDMTDVDFWMRQGPTRLFITNYDRADRFDAAQFGGVVLDESSCLKHYSKTFFALVEQWADTPFRLCCTATPAPNDFVEFGNHALFLGIMHFKDMLARWFVGEGDIARQARLKGHARKDFWRWLTSWAVCISKPSDLGPAYDMPGYDLPPLEIHEYVLKAPQQAIERAHKQGQLYPDDAPSATGFMKVKRESLQDRVAQAREIVAAIGPDEPVVLWCDTNFEADALIEAFPEAREVRGDQPAKVKEAALKGFTAGAFRILITKPEIAGFGMNWQHCCQMVFVGVSFSFERWWQAIGRIYRFGQKRAVHIHLIFSEIEGNVRKLLERKEKDFAVMIGEMREAVQTYGLYREGKHVAFTKTDTNTVQGEGYTYHLGDCVEVMATFEPDSVDLTVTSIPFSNLYIYSDKEADVGNAASKDEFFEHMAFVIRELYRITVPGRCCAVHVKDLPLFINRDGVMGIDPFSDDVTAAFRAGGWVLQSRVTIPKDPVIEMQKTNSHGLLFMNYREHAEILRTGLPDYVLIFQKPGECPRPVVHDPSARTYFGTNPPPEWRIPKLPSRKTGAINTALPTWQNYANPSWDDVVVPLTWSDLPADDVLEALGVIDAETGSPFVWDDIQQTEVLNKNVAKDNKDERHLCPLQTDLIDRLIHWKSNPGDVVFDPFGGIASTPVQAIKAGRRGLGVELKESYWKLGLKELDRAAFQLAQPTLYDMAEVVK